MSENRAVATAPAQSSRNGQPSGRTVPREERVRDILGRVRNEVKDDAAFLDAWREVVSETQVMFRGKQMLMSDVIKYMVSELAIPLSPDTVDVRRKEVQIGNLLQEIVSELAVAEAGSRMFGERKKDMLSRGKNKKTSQVVLEAELVATDAEFRMTRGIWLSAELNYQFWQRMHSLCTDTLKRLQQIYNTLAAESRVRS